MSWMNTNTAPELPLLVRINAFSASPEFLLVDTKDRYPRDRSNIGRRVLICRNELVRMTVETVIVRVFQSQQTNRNYGAYQLHFGSGYCLYFNRRLETGK